MNSRKIEGKNREEDMGTRMNRRQWLKKSASAPTGLLVAPEFVACRRQSPLSRSSPEPKEIILLDSNESPYGMPPEARRAVLDRVPVNERYELDLDAMVGRMSKDTSLVYVCNPNNPTGTIVNKDKLRAFCAEASKKALVVVDEAYHECVEDETYASMVSLVRDGMNVAVTRTFSKVYGLAGLRVGYEMARPDILKNFEQVQMNFASVAYSSLRAAIAAYGAATFISLLRGKNRVVRAYLERELRWMYRFFICCSYGDCTRYCNGMDGCSFCEF